MDKHFVESIVTWFSSFSPRYPWQSSRDPYAIWISEVMLQQTTVHAVEPYYIQWMQRFPRLEDLAVASDSEVLRLFEGLGYYSRARNLHQSAQQLVRDYQGIFPQDYHLLRTLPGIGDYTARALCSLSFRQRYVLIDANVRRVLQRYYAYPLWEKDMKSAYLALEKSQSARRLALLNEGLMRLGQEICRKKPLCLLCPLRASCRALATDCVTSIPRTRRKVVREISSSRVLVVAENFLLVQKPALRGRFRGLATFMPLDELLAFRSDESWDISHQEESSFSFTHNYTNFKEKVSLSVWWLKKLPEESLENGLWIQHKDLVRQAFPSVYRRVLHFLEKKLERFEEKDY